MNKIVTILYRVLPHYRVAFYNELRDRLSSDGIQLQLVYGNATQSDALRRDTVSLPWASYRPSRFLRVRDRQLTWQPAFRIAVASDLVIVEDASRLLLNYLLLAAQAARRARVAFWGHGANLQRQTAHPLGEAVKRHLVRRPHWWFAYTEGTRDRIVSRGYPPERVTVVQNAADTAELQHSVDTVTAEQRRSFRERWGIGSGPLVLFIGSLYSEKRLDFLVRSLLEAHARIPSLRLLIIGDGPERGAVIAATREHQWIRYLGPLFERDKALALAEASLIAMPGPVGLVILDAFASGVPLVTTNIDSHGPEIEYLRDGVNGLVARPSHDARAFAAALCSVVEDPTLKTRLQEGCLRAAAIYTIEEMVERFRTGIHHALAAPPCRGECG